MQMTGNTILITGGGSGIGRALAEAFHARGNDVIIAGRRREVLDEVTAANAGMKSAVLDIENAEAIRSFAAQLKADHPALNVVIHNAGIMRAESIQSGNIDDAEATIEQGFHPARINPVNPAIGSKAMDEKHGLALPHIVKNDFHTV